MRFNFTVHVCGVTALHYLHISGAVSETSARRGCSIVEAMRSAWLRSQSLKFRLISQRFVRSRGGKGGTTRRRSGGGRRGRHSNSMKEAAGEGSVEVGSQKAFPAGEEKPSRFMLRSAGSPDSFSGGDEARGEERNHR